MPYSKDEIDHVMQEQRALLQHCAELQQRCTAQIQAQAHEVRQLQAEVVRLRAREIALRSTLAWEREERQAVEMAMLARLQALLQRPRKTMPPELPTLVASPVLESAPLDMPASADPEWLEYSLSAADLVICQTGCVSHGAFWRVENHCRRTGKTCVLMEQPDALRIVRLQSADLADPATPQMATAPDVP